MFRPVMSQMILKRITRLSSSVFLSNVKLSHLGLLYFFAFFWYIDNYVIEKQIKKYNFFLYEV